MNIREPGTDGGEASLDKDGMSAGDSLDWMNGLAMTEGGFGPPASNENPWANPVLDGTSVVHDRVNKVLGL